jgi:hypothetical protein
MAICRIRDHVWKPTRDGKYDRCEKCKTFFPCKHECKHPDCVLARSGRAHELGIKLQGWPLTEKDPWIAEEEENKTT